ncbi:TVP38/TMEM64 family protein [Rhodococcus sp. SGAir0479]|uniref:TVP38/TMEM64 family protein n=1 Tax=Rhodococcus sp. SGAir0479 TaxID=2567884 RepID=UPI0020C7B155|nr:TVP38/TMEM64 family protein [Rhodococcus sp. SGAir0479]
MIARLRDPRLLGALAGLLVLFVAAALVPHPSIEQIRGWSESTGPVFPLVFLLVHIVVTIAPVPRTLFTISAGVLFGAATGIAIAVVATTVSAVLALLLVRAIGRDAVAAHLTHPAVQAVDTRLARRGWLAVGSLRLIAAVPFSVVNYCCGVSSVRTLPYTAATVVGILPGTVGVVLLGDALTGRTDPALLAVSGACIALGVLGLVLDARTPVSASSTVRQGQGTDSRQ